MTRLPSWIPLRESRIFIVACALVFVALLAVRVGVDKPDKQERAIAKRKAEGKTIAPEAYVPVWLYKGLKLNLVIAGGMLLVSPWLGRKRALHMTFMPEPTRSAFSKWQFLACAAVIGFAAWQNSPRLFYSMWGDEEFNASRFIVDSVAHDNDGKPEREPDGRFKIERRSWATTLWNMRKPTNHLGYSFFARLTHDTLFHKGTGPNDPWFSEALLRTPVFIAGLLLLPALLWALRVWSFNGWWSVLFMALHPWFVRFGVDGRGYGFVMLGITLLIGITGRALQTARWRWWLLFGATGFFIFWSNLHSAYLLVALNLMILTWLFTQGMNGPGRWLQISRWLTGNILAVMLLVGWMSPCLPQFLEYLKEGDIRDTLDLRWWQDSFCALAFGQPWFPWAEPDNPLLFSMSQSVSQSPVLHVAGILLFVALVSWGLICTARSARLRPLLMLILGAPTIMIAHMAATHVRPYDWYLVPYLPGLMFLIAAAFHSRSTSPAVSAVGVPPAVSQSSASPRLPWLAIGLVVFTLFAFITQTQRHFLRHGALEQSRESVAFYRPVINPRHPDIDKVLSAGLAMYTEGYDPVLFRVKDVDSMRSLMAEADRSGRPLWFNCGFMRFLRIQENTAPMCKLLEDDSLFERAHTFWGMLPYTTRDVYRYRGAR